MGWGGFASGVDLGGEAGEEDLSGADYQHVAAVYAVLA